MITYWKPSKEFKTGMLVSLGFSRGVILKEPILICGKYYVNIFWLNEPNNKTKSGDYSLESLCPIKVNEN